MPTPQSYTPPSTNAQYINNETDIQGPVPEGSYNMFSSPTDDAAMLPIMQACDPGVQVSDGATMGLIAGKIIYGSDGRKITVYQGTDPVYNLPYQTTVGQLIQAQNSGGTFNNERQPPYTKIFIDGVAFSGPGGTGAPGAVEVVWGH
jgi:hypothetical protein